MMSFSTQPTAGPAECTTLAITGSKGGVGKSNLTVNLAISLSKLGRRVLVVDGDLGLANLDVLLGLVPTRTVEHRIRGEATLEELLMQGPGGIRILVDTGAGLGEVALSFQLAASRVLVVNNVRDDTEADRAFEQISRAAQHFLNNEPGKLGAIYSDARVGDAVRRQKPVIELFPTCQAARCYERIALQLVSSPGPFLSAPDYWQTLLQTDEKEMPN